MGEACTLKKAKKVKLDLGILFFCLFHLVYQIQVKIIDSRNYTYESFGKESKKKKKKTGKKQNRGAKNASNHNEFGTFFETIISFAILKFF